MGGGAERDSEPWPFRAVNLLCSVAISFEDGLS